MKEVVACGSTSSVTASPFAAYSPAQPRQQTPSPFAFSVASTRWSSRPPIQTVDLCLRLLSLVFSFASALSLVALLISASSVAIPVVQHMYNGNSYQKATIVSVSMSFASFLVIAATAILSGYKLCKRIVW